MTTKTDSFTDLKRALQKFQAERLANTYRDFKNDPEYRLIGKFFFERLYASEDFSFRDQSIRRLHQVLKGSVYKGIISAVSLVIELHELSDELDDRMVETMIDKGIGADFGDRGYNDAYRALDNYDERLHQIELTLEACRAFHRLSKMWVVAVSLKTVRKAARLLGVASILDFVHEGYVALQTIDDIDYFLDTVNERELARHEAIWYETARDNEKEGNRP